MDRDTYCTGFPSVILAGLSGLVNTGGSCLSNNTWCSCDNGSPFCNSMGSGSMGTIRACEISSWISGRSGRTTRAGSSRSSYWVVIYWLSVVMVSLPYWLTVTSLSPTTIKRKTYKEILHELTLNSHKIFLSNKFKQIQNTHFHIKCFLK